MSKLDKFGTIPLFVLSALIPVGIFAGYAYSENQLDKMWADAGKTRPTAEQVAASEAKQEHGSTFEYRRCNSKLDPFGIVCK